MNFEIFKNMFFENILLLYRLGKETPKNILSIKNNYNRQKGYLLENLNFLIRINFFIIKNNEISVNINEEEKIGPYLIELIMKDPEYGSCLKNYLINFKINNYDLPSFVPIRFYNYETSYLRDFLISLGYVKNNGNEFQLIKPEILNIFKNFKLTPEALEKKLLNQKLLGLNAEKLIFKNEKVFLINQGINKNPIHISIEDVSAGYDILSFRKENDIVKEIYIEVKAVSLSDYQFHLSTSEYQTSIKFNPNYYIYLLPVDYSLTECFDLNSLLKINKIKENIFENKIDWKVLSDGHLITKNKIQI